MIQTKTVRLHKKVYDRLVEIANYTGISVGSVISDLSTFGCKNCGTRYLVDSKNWTAIQRIKAKFYDYCDSCKTPIKVTPKVAKVLAKEPGPNEVGKPQTYDSGHVR